MEKLNISKKILLSDELFTLCVENFLCSLADKTINEINFLKNNDSYTEKFALHRVKS